jgi:gamma-glutamylaminecyclotransferase
MQNENLVFVFGTLKEGFPNFATNQGTRRPGEFVTVERFPLYLIGERMSPWMIAKPGDGLQVRGQIFSVSANVLSAMDTLERIHEPDGYRRLKISVTSVADDERKALEVFAYLKPAEQFEIGMIKKGPLASYELSDALLYRPRAAA